MAAALRIGVHPDNEAIPSGQMTAIESFVGSGGKLMVFYLLNDRLDNLLAVDRTGWTPGSFGSFTFSDATIPHLPARVAQGSWNVTIAAPRTTLNSRVIATWKDAGGVSTPYPAWLASDNGLFMSHVLLDDDPENKRVMLLALMGYYVPELWPIASASSFDNIGRIAEYTSYDSVVADIQSRGAATPRSAQVQIELAGAASARSQASAQRAAGQHADAVFSALDARAHVLKAYELCQSPALPELRAVWEHQATGPYPGNWPAAIDALVANGFSAVFPNMLWGGLAHYSSALLPHSAEFNAYGDQIQACVQAAHARGVEVHVWKVNYNLSTAPQSFIDSMRAAGRTQVSSTGQPIDWLCPSHPDNFALERDSMLEVVRNYDVDGIHFDYIRYPGSDSCYCDGCRVRFQAQTGNTVVNWPSDVLATGALRDAFQAWRRKQITDLVTAVYAGTKAIKPHVKVSAAVWSHYTDVYNQLGQDWVGWIDRGIVDFLCPMDYTAEQPVFRNLVNQQMGYAAGRVPIYPGIGASATTPALGPDGVIDTSLINETLPPLAMGATIPGRVAETPDGRWVPGTPLTVRKTAGGPLALQWGHACDYVTGTRDYVVYQGSLSALRAGVWDHVPVIRTTSGGTSATLSATGSAAYFLVVPNDTSREGGYGFDSSGHPRPASGTPRFPQSRTVCP